ncbi:MAG: 2-oxo acid dehydrogenase subunit E2 [Deltaproteobacteria bacterium]|nr:2-oxo acid dehydrogenase subunit E2 [Deltaproteobacteria bacterium]
MGEFRMPSLGADMEAGTLVEWRIRPGDGVKRGDIVALVETEKGVIEVEIFASGIVDSILASPGEKVPVGTVLATIRVEGEPAEAAAPSEKKPPEVPKPAAPAPEAPAWIAPIREARTARPLASPVARRRAEESGLDLSSVTGTGEGGIITLADVEGAPSRIEEKAKRSLATADQLTAMRRAIAAAMTRSKREIPHYYLATPIGMSRAVAWLREVNLGRPVTNRLLYSVLILRAVALALRDFPEMNGFWLDGAFKPGSGIHVGIAISLRQGGLVAPAIHDVDKKDLEELMRSILDLVNRARTGMLRSSELSDATITVSNLGEQGVETIFGIIYPPQVALVAFGALTEQPWAENGMVGARSVIMAGLSADHRASDGHRGGRFLSAIDRLLQEPEKL